MVEGWQKGGAQGGINLHSYKKSIRYQVNAAMRSACALKKLKSSNNCSLKVDLFFYFEKNQLIY